MRTTLFTIVGAAGALFAAPALAQVAATVTDAPTAAEVAAAFPERAKAAGVSGAVALNCTVTRHAGLSGCVAVGEEPRGYGFAAAALRVARSIKVADGRDAQVLVPVNFSTEVLKPGFTAVTPKWTATPTAADFQATIPKHENGPNDIRVTLVCDVQAGGTLSGCVVDRETPAGQGFGEAVLALAPKFKVEPWSAEGQPVVGAKVRVPVRYDLKPVNQAAR